MKNIEIEFTEPIERCRTTCLGDCCRRMPRICSPEDIVELFPAETIEESVRLALNTGNYSIDWYGDDVPKFYLRPATVVGRGLVYDASWGGRCVFYTELGCTLQKRPYTCRTLKAGKHFCESTLPENEKLYMSKLWLDVVNLNEF